MSNWAFDGDVLSSLKKLEGAIRTLASKPVIAVTETLTSETWLKERVYQQLFEIAALPSTATLTVEHGLSNFKLVEIKGMAESAGTYLPIPYSDTAAVGSQIEIFIDGTNINIVTGSDRSAYTAEILLRYTKGR